jgi:serine/threonine protein kinase
MERSDSPNEAAPTTLPQILAGRFVLLDEVRPGGMGYVQKATDLKTAQFAAIKRINTSGDEQRWRTSFSREVEAIRKLEHPNIIKFLTVDRDIEGRWFLAMEWIDQNLEDFVVEQGPMSWSRFVSEIGMPLLSALEYAQGRKIVHRDVNPRNILVTARGAPKLVDFGISKELDGFDGWAPVAGRTFFSARTVGYSPREADDRLHSLTRDCFSLAAVATFCLTGHKLQADSDLEIALNEAPFPDPVRPLIERALSDEPKQRPFDARTMRLELERIEEARTLAGAGAIRCYLDLSRTAENRLRPVLELQTRNDIQQFILDELTEVHALALHRETDDAATHANALIIVGATWRFRAILGGRSLERLEIVDARDIDAARASRLREEGYRVRLEFSFGLPLNTNVAADTLQELLNQVVRHTAERDAAQRALNSERILRAWRGYLRDRARLELIRENAIRYTDRRIKQNEVVFTADIAPSMDVIGEERLIRVGGLHIFGKVTQIFIDSVTFEVTTGDPEMLPRKGELLVNTIASERALNYQSTALDAVVYGRAVNPRLKSILLEPHSAHSPEKLDPKEPKDTALRGEKLAALRHALGTNEILAIEGPPGTGKTELISEITVAWLARFPDHRILLSSQTHNALDEAIERIGLLKRDGATAVVRIGRTEDPRIAEFSKPLMLEQKVEAWANQVRSLAESNMATWAQEHGVDRTLVALGMKVERLCQVLRQIEDVERRILIEETQVGEAEERLDAGIVTPDESEELDFTTIEGGSEITLLKDTLKQLRRQERDVRVALQASPDLGPDIARLKEVAEIQEWQSVYLDGSDVVRQCYQRLALLEDWLLRVGRTGDFNAAVLNSADIIAGTCVGIAGVKGIEEVEYDLCIIDEASKATATEILIPLSRSRRWIIVGDPKQLPPFFEEFGEDLLREYDEKNEIRPTILDRMVDPKLGLPLANRIKLKVQHRMITPIGSLVSDCFYDGTLQSPIASHGITLQPEIPAAVTWYTTSREPRRVEQAVGKSFDNVLEVEWTRHVLGQLQKAAARQAKQMSVAVISGYTAQVKRLTKMTNRNASDWPQLKISCNSVHAFQGKQADVCVYSVVRSNLQGKLGFLNEKPLLNVALSRAKSGLILIGDHYFCRTARGVNPFKSVINWIEAHDKTCHVGSLP